ncbi:penicillin-binding protein 1C [Corallococcus exercitus]|uniref:peptidoglycan glycosyltransferase n=1 Tax=Corallococcus exercitus TaxID=2316736 RepID=A0A3A8HM85_9BACT|nr:penicillin-binding protein 1C [Corallococcus exercitus]NOK38778.1 penicillin-binding protein 1C [Corallococcus exercitus]RKG68624.1 penicillin-binding protein 1C [Corallococcus exercitus]
MRRVRLNGRKWAGVALAGLVLLGTGLLAAWWVPLPERLAAPPSVVMAYRDGSPAYVFLAPDERWRIPAPKDRIDRAYVRALVALEDKRFFQHPGVDPLAALRALGLNLSRGRRVSGASTLTMQLVRVLEPRPRTFTSKVIESFRAAQLEARLSKQEVLEAYLQFVPYGRNVEGVEAAALAYFGHTARHLSPAEIATLLAVPQNPNRRFPSPENRDRLRSARDDIARRLLESEGLVVDGVASDTVLAEVRATPVPDVLTPFPREAPHAAVWLKAQRPGATWLATTLDAGTQRFVERTLGEAARRLERQGIHNGAVVVADRDTGELRALVGNFDFFDEKHGGQIIGFATPRSPGSALKPLLYALGIDQGLVGPETLVPDIPVAYGGYQPRNFDGRFLGLVRMETALSQSLNLPFVRLLERVGVEGFLGSLRQAGVTSLDPRPGHYGLSAAVGGLELTPLELTGVYLALAGDGQARPLRVLDEDTAPKKAQTLVSPGAAWLTRQALALRDRPDFPERRRLTGLPARVHWKTGTSFGNRDAWAAGSGPKHTAVVWLGNFDHSSSVHLVGAENAAPLLFDILEGIGPRGTAVQEEDATPPKDLVSVEVCAYSGHLPTDACTQRKRVDAVRTAVPTTPCPYHHRVEVDVASGLAVGPGCRDGRKTESRVYLTWPSSLRRWLAEQQRQLPEPPPLAPGCVAGGERDTPTILSPPEGQVALLIPGMNTEEQKIPLEAEAAHDRELTWFVDGAVLGTARAAERLWWKPSVGTHDILVTDDHGLTARRTLVVRERQ